MFYYPGLLLIRAACRAPGPGGILDRLGSLAERAEPWKRLHPPPPPHRQQEHEGIRVRIHRVDGKVSPGVTEAEVGLLDISPHVPRFCLEGLQEPPPPPPEIPLKRPEGNISSPWRLLRDLWTFLKEFSKVLRKASQRVSRTSFKVPDTVAVAPFNPESFSTLFGSSPTPAKEDEREQSLYRQ
ncbi:hypothetical protein F2P81_002839 [Scophthalmus maximus]|uniref:Uncharacterized protein n=1 Tax=Scophthalmus maximus TaxID=52904 RepID=A0A6A4TRS1_SCOMX|nr:hypothetical protein F2P81_002839 [Scophthalmus maximus]